MARQRNAIRFRPRQARPRLADTRVGSWGASVLYSGALGRFRREDLYSKVGDQLDGVASLPDDWPIDFDELRGYYRSAEARMRVVGERDPLDEDDDSEPAAPPPLSNRDAAIVGDLKCAGMHPYRLRVGIDYMPGCEECQDRRCPRLCKADGYSRALLPALETGRIRLDLGVVVSEILPAGDLWAVTGRGEDGTMREHRGRSVIVAAGALNTPLLLNRSDQLWRDVARPAVLGRGLLFHFSDIILVSLRRKSPPEDAAGPSKTIAFRDLYGSSDGVGEVQSYGPGLTARLIMNGLRTLLYDAGLEQFNRIVALAFPLAALAARVWKSGVVFATISPDRPFAENRVWEEVGPEDTSAEATGRARIAFTYSVPRQLRARSRGRRRLLTAAFAPNRVRFLLPAGTPNLGHPMGTCRMGSDPAHSVVDPRGQVWEHPGLYVGDASVFPSSAGVGPSLTVAALGLRLGDHLASVLERHDGGNATLAGRED
ncbi:GMC family oxidoreductase [Mycobacterium sp. OTB74]|uniref:GMC oxidoreductase n=1 Tax=Mycobacterium sp. OTB74 TaxID=1853452 RepID=UPI002475E88C|nr:GMC family oxidoreductase [Mycobacterium sp. OTB74]MDH6243520.1 choline dehydrogenase-like flavoprotein [Mycobacterium sp. OTB74]